MEQPEAPRKHRTATTAYEQSILVSYIRKFFEFPDRSEERSQLVQEVMVKLNSSARQWTPRAIRLWFNNNRKHYLQDEVFDAGRGDIPPISEDNGVMNATYPHYYPSPGPYQAAQPWPDNRLQIPLTNPQRPAVRLPLLPAPNIPGHWTTSFFQMSGISMHPAFMQQQEQ